MEWLPGHRLESRSYVIERKLDSGAFGVTYKAQNLGRLKVPVAIKTPNGSIENVDNYPKYLQSFKKEANQLAKLGVQPTYVQNRTRCKVM